VLHDYVRKVMTPALAALAVAGLAGAAAAQTSTLIIAPAAPPPPRVETPPPPSGDAVTGQQGHWNRNGSAWT
jgi:hypothetical protein